MKGYHIHRGKLPLGYVFLAGMLSRMLIMSFGKSILLENTGLLDEYTLYHMKYMTVDRSALFYYILCLRMKTAIILVVLATTYLGLAVCAGAAFWYGLSAGAFVTAVVIRYGLKGILLAFVSITPQCFIYVPAFMVLLWWCEALNRTIYLDKNTLTQGAGEITWLRRGGQLALILLVLLLGCLLEGFTNPGLMEKLLKIF